MIHRQTGLPIYDPDTTVISGKAAMAHYASSGAARMVRRVGLMYPEGTGDLQSFLELADNTAQDVAAHCGATVVDHTFGLYKPPYRIAKPQTIPDGSDNLIPEGYQLVADVAVIADAQSVPHTMHAALRAKMFSYFEQGRDTVHADLSIDQLVLSKTAGGLVLADIEPKIDRIGQTTIEIAI